MTTTLSEANADAAPEAVPPPIIPPWGELGLPDDILAAVEARGYEKPTAVQAQAVPLALEGRDLLVRSKTGTGKTAAFLIPTLSRVPSSYGKNAVIALCPTRELAIQTAEEAELLCKGKDLRVCACYGGVSIGPQTDALRAGAEIVIGTPGRVLDHIRRGNLRLGEGLVGILDEADEMLSMGFYEEVTGILKELPKEAQILLFSATVEQKLKTLIGKFLKDPAEIYLSLDTDRTVDAIHHVLYETTLDYPKPRQLLHVVETESPDSSIVFCNTRSDTDLVARFLNRQGLVAEPISSDLSQKARERVMALIKRGEIDILVATDIAARGIDISDLSHVFNYSLPEDPAVYLHRTGRTGRIGNKGTAISFVGGRELACKKVLVEKYEIDFEERTLPSREEADERWTERHIGEMRRAAREGIPFEGFIGMARSLLERGGDSDVLIAVALRGFFRWHRMNESRKAMEAAGEDPEAIDAMMSERRGKGRGPRGGSGGGGRRGGHGGGGGGGGGGGRGGRRRRGRGEPNRRSPDRHDQSGENTTS